MKTWMEGLALLGERHPDLKAVQTVSERGGHFIIILNYVCTYIFCIHLECILQ